VSNVHKYLQRVELIYLRAAVAFISFAQTSGLAISLTITNTLFLNLASKYIGDALPDASSAQVKSAISGVGGSFIASLTQTQQASVIHALIDAISKCYLVLVALAGVEFIASGFLKWERVFLEV